MGAVKLHARSCPENVDGIALDPEPDWSFDALLSELDSLEKKLQVSSAVRTTKPLGLLERNGVRRSPNAFVMSVSDEEIDDESESEDERAHDRSLVTHRRFACDELYFSDDSGDKTGLEVQPYLMNEAGLVEGTLFETTNEHQLGVKEELRSRISALETDLMNESEKHTSARAQVEKYREARREAERKFDVQYQRKIAEAVDNHLTAIQRDHELKSQVEERKIRNDAAYEEAKRKEKALQEERLQQEKAKAEAEAKLRAEEARRAALEAEKRAAIEAERKAAQEAAVKEATKPIIASSSRVSQGEAAGPQKTTSLEALNAKSKNHGVISERSRSDGVTLRAAESALMLERDRLKRLKEFDETNQSLRSSSRQDFTKEERSIARLIRQITGTKENVRTKANDILKIFKSHCPQTISLAAFAKKVVLHRGTAETTFACCHVIVLVTSQFPLAMDLLLAEFHAACIYTVPKHLGYSQSSFKSPEAYFKAIGYREESGKIESRKDYLDRLENYMKLYGALVQTEVEGVQNIHGLKEGWAWLARFLNALPPNIYTATALTAFLRMAGFALFRKYKSQFRKMLNLISDEFLRSLKARGDPDTRPIITELQSYIEDNKFLKEPEGRTLQRSLLSTEMVPGHKQEGSYGESYDFYRPQGVY